MTVYHLAETIEASALGQTIRESTWLFPAIEATHLLALALLGGSVLLIALAVLGVGLRTPVAQLYSSARKYMNTAVIALLLTGLLLGISEPIKLYGREAFWIKMISLALALPITYFIFGPQVAKGGRGFGAQAAALLTIAAWLVVAMAGRWIGFS